MRKRKPAQEDILDLLPPQLRQEAAPPTCSCPTCSTWAPAGRAPEDADVEVCPKGERRAAWSAERKQWLTLHGYTSLDLIRAEGHPALRSS
jgi:hypothetical protein